MWFRRVNRGSPDQVFTVFRNCMTASTIDIGEGVFYAFHSSTYNDGINACFWTNTMAHRNLAGVCARYPVGPGEYGMAQCYGYCNSVSVRGWTAGNQFTNWVGIEDWFLSGYQTEPGRFYPCTRALFDDDACAVVHPVHTRMNGDTTTLTASYSTIGYLRSFIRAM